MSGDSNVRLLSKLARLYGVQFSYYDVLERCRKNSPPESIAAILRSLGAPLNNLSGIPSALRSKQQEIMRRRLEPLIVCWDGKSPGIKIRLPIKSTPVSLKYYVKLEDSEERSGNWKLFDVPITETAEIEGIEYSARLLYLPFQLPLGYHRLIIDFPGGSEESLIISAPLQACSSGEKAWGFFLPLYALRTHDSWGSGDYSDLASITDWLSASGGNVLATLPLLPPLMNSEPDFSPYRPSSRLFWNEFYIDIKTIPELIDCPEAQNIINSTPFQGELSALRNMPLVDYKRLMTLKRRVLEELSRHLFLNMSPRLNEFFDFIKKRPEIEKYARFNAGENESARRYHLYAQWLAHQQMESASGKAKEKGIGLYLDLPLGVHPDGYDAFRYRDAFMSDIQAGAPPDIVFTGGQNWQFPPLHPQNIRESKYEYVIAYLRHHMEHAGILRIDHVMGFHRLFCIPEGMKAGNGAYVRYPAEEFYAILTLESQRHQTVIIGEDLGNVPRYVRPAMKKHGINRMYVLRYELAGNTGSGLHPVPADAAASLNTHDMPPFAAFWQGLDIAERVRLGVLNEKLAQTEKANLPFVRNSLVSALRHGGWLSEKEDSIESIIKACLAYLSSSPAGLVLINLEDLWLETVPQNVPGTLNEYPNWRSKMKRTFEEFCQLPQVIDILKLVAELRKQAAAENKSARTTFDQNPKV